MTAPDLTHLHISSFGTAYLGIVRELEIVCGAPQLGEPFSSKQLPMTIATAPCSIQKVLFQIRRITTKPILGACRRITSANNQFLLLEPPTERYTPETAEIAWRATCAGKFDCWNQDAKDLYTFEGEQSGLYTYIRLSLCTDS
jgi:hypothetical protein